MDDPQELETRQSIGHVLRTHPEGQSLFGEAGHYCVLAEQSAVAVTRAFTGHAGKPDLPTMSSDID